MADIFRTIKNKNYTVMSNHHLQNPTLSLKAMGLMSKILSLPEDWNYSVKGLAAYCKDGYESVRTALLELEAEGYLIRRTLRGERGKIAGTEYIFRETPDMEVPETEEEEQDQAAGKERNVAEDEEQIEAMEDRAKEVKKQDMLSAAFVFLAQGTPFINGGQEFLRTKKGDENSYESPDSINQIDIGFKDTYSDVYNTYKGLIALRKANPAAFGENYDAEAETLSSGVTKYTTGDFLVFFNATPSDYPIQEADKTGYTKAVDVSSGDVVESVESENIPSSVPAKGFVILKK